MKDYIGGCIMLGLIVVCCIISIIIRCIGLGKMFDEYVKGDYENGFLH